eukprot:NP_001024650.1 Wrapper/Rega-1/Klingon homolog [Caenorhabditis elegans]
MMKLVLLILGLLIASTSAQIRTKGGTLIAKEGESLTLRCEVEDPSVAIIWRKNTEVVAVDDEILDTYGGYEISMEGSVTRFNLHLIRIKGLTKFSLSSLFEISSDICAHHQESRANQLG